MHTSPFQPPSPRQNVLAAQIQAAHAAGDQRRLLLLRSQWVHRFGVEALPELQSAPSPFGHLFSLIQEPLEEPTYELTTNELTTNGETTYDQPTLDQPTFTACLTAVGDQAVGDEAVGVEAVGDGSVGDEAVAGEQPEERAVAEEQLGEEAVTAEQPGDRAAFVDAESDLEVAGAEAPTAAETPVLHVAMQRVPEPPLTTPRSLRRWLASDSESVPKAS